MNWFSRVIDRIWPKAEVLVNQSPERAQSTKVLDEVSIDTSTLPTPTVVERPTLPTMAPQGVTSSVSSSPSLIQPSQLPEFVSDITIVRQLKTEVPVNQSPERAQSTKVLAEVSIDTSTLPTPTVVERPTPPTMAPQGVTSSVTSSSSPIQPSQLPEFVSGEIIARVLMDWAKPQDSALRGIRYPKLQTKFAESLLLPFQYHPPEEVLREEMKSFLIQRIGDPRLNPGAWQAVNGKAKEVLLQWLVGETLEVFFKILDQTADEIWKYRKAFWSAYYRKGFISEAWVVLGRDARALGQDMKRRLPTLDFGLLEGGGDNQSALILRLDKLVIVEGSHNRKCRFWMNNPPSLYRKDYRFDELREQCQHEQAHHGSEYDSWQCKIRDYIHEETGMPVIKSTDWS